MEDLKHRFNNINFDRDESVIKFIQSIQESDLELFSGINVNKETIVLGLSNQGFKVSTYQNNGWIRINEYNIIDDKNSRPQLIRSESYEKGDV